jgi:uncharacterized protein (UPF0276 family)
MEIAINWSPQAAALLTARRIHPDRFKCPDWPDLVAQARVQAPIYVHFPLLVGAGQIQDADWTTVERLLVETETPFINLHLNPKRSSFTDPSPEAIQERLLTEVAWVVQRFGAERVIVENVIYTGVAGAIPAAGVDPLVIGRIVRETGCGLLLDLAHAWISAHHLGVDPQAYCAAMPVHALRELHVTGTHHDGERWRDHMRLREADWALFDFAMAEIRAGHWARPRLVAFEYGGIGEKFNWRSEGGVIAAQFPRLAAAVRTADTVAAQGG